MGGGDKYDDDSLDVFQFFNNSCYKGFGDDDEVRNISCKSPDIMVLFSSYSANINIYII